MAKTYADNIGKGSLILVEGEFRSYTRDKEDGVEYELKLERGRCKRRNYNNKCSTVNNS